MATLKNTTIDDTGYIRLPSGTTAQRPGSPANGMVRWNTDLGYDEYYSSVASDWVEVGVSPFPFVSATGGTITTSGDYKIHTFTSSGTFTVTDAGGASGSNSVDYLVIAGGGGAGGKRAGGGGAGGYRESYPNPATGGFPVTVSTYPITVGSGGSNNPGQSPGSNSVFSTITSTGGGTSNVYNPSNSSVPAPNINGQPGGSGGGSGRGEPNQGFGTGGTGNSPPVTPSQGNPGGSNPPGTPLGGGGGGGASAAGTSRSPSGNGTNGGDGKSSTITGSSVTRGGGGAGGSAFTPNSGGSGGAGGGGDSFSAANGEDGAANTGGGGGAGFDGGPSALGGNGGSGVVIIRYKFQ